MNPPKRQVTWPTVVIATSALALSGCGGGGDSAGSTSAAAPTTATPSPSPTPSPTPTPTPTPITSLMGATPLFMQGNGEDYLFVCETFISDRDTTLIETLIEPQSGGVLMFDNATETYEVGFEDFSKEFTPEDFFIPSPGVTPSRFYQNFSATRDTRFGLSLFAPVGTFAIGKDTSEALEDAEAFSFREQKDGTTVGSFTGEVRELTCIYGLSFASGQLPTGGQVSFDDAGLFSESELVTWTASFDPSNSEISFQIVIGNRTQVSGTGSSVTGVTAFRTVISAAFSGRAIVDPETGKFEGTITQLDDFDDPDISSSVLVGSDFTVEEGAFSGSFLGGQGDQFAFSYNIRLSEDDPDSRPTVFDGAIIATSTGNQNP